MKQFLTPVAFALIFISCANGQTKKDNMEQQEISNKQKAVELLKSIETGAKEPVAYINAASYTQHNLGVADGLAGFGEALSHLPPNSGKANTVRAFQDGEFVFTHTDYNFFGPKIGFDVFRFKDGKIVEHWDNLQEKPTQPNPSGRTMLDGPTESSDLSKTDVNKKLVERFVTDILVQGKMDQLASYFDGDNYLQHNPQVADGLSGLGAALEHMAAQGITMKYDKIHKVLGEGNFVLTISEGAMGDTPTSFYDLFRVEDGKIAEHWDVIEPILPKDTRKNENGKFNF